MKESAKTFSLDGPKAYLEKIEWELSRLNEISPRDQPAYQFQAINCAMTAWHMTDWVFHKLPPDERARYKGEGEFREWARQDFIGLKLCREIADASKHVTLTRKVEPYISTEKIRWPTDTGEAEFWYIDGGNGEFYALPEIIEGAITYWQNFLVQHRIT